MGIKNKIHEGQLYYLTLTVVDWVDVFANDPVKGGTPGSAAKSTTDPEPLRPDWAKVRDVRDGKFPLSALSNDCQ